MLMKYIKILMVTAFIFALYFPLSVYPVSAQSGEETQSIKEKPQDSSETIRDALEELYRNYEVIDQRIEELELDIGDLQRDSILTPLTMSVKKGDSFRIISLEVKDNGVPLWNHFYTPTENSALRNNGRHQFYRGAIERGGHSFTLKYQYQLEGQSNFKSDEVLWKTVTGAEAAFIEITFVLEDNDVKARPKRLQIIIDSQGQ